MSQANTTEEISPVSENIEEEDRKGCVLIKYNPNAYIPVFDMLNDHRRINQSERPSLDRLRDILQWQVPTSTQLAFDEIEKLRTSEIKQQQAKLLLMQKGQKKSAPTPTIAASLPSSRPGSRVPTATGSEHPGHTASTAASPSGSQTSIPHLGGSGTFSIIPTEERLVSVNDPLRQRKSSDISTMMLGLVTQLTKVRDHSLQVIQRREHPRPHPSGRRPVKRRSFNLM
eukprot:gnl/Dysnectes_brevis/3710_a4752_529.p1 GENE.gnl/Dysnectes_brevis/3710_a4752_529~~gnl/Dysnectes_brevis/3710_a4752_529.p1  ORF type:complete len:228 (+),score=24.97 gnl/Dysnectes_brevis/3710_a4752_529:68-751(+)